MGIIKTRYEKGQDATYNAAAALIGGRLAKLSAVGVTQTKPKIVHTQASADYSVGAVFVDAALDEDVGVTHRGWQLLETSGAIAFNTDVYPSSNGRIQNVASPVAADRAYGRSFGVATIAGEFVWVKVYT